MDSLNPYRQPNGEYLRLFEGDDLGDAIESAPEPVLILDDGDYVIGTLHETYQGKGKHIFAANSGGARILGGDSDTIALLGDGAALGPITFEGLVIEGSARAAIITNNKPDTPYEISLSHCVIDGMYDHDLRSGRDSRWGLMTHLSKIYAQDTVFRRMKREHGAYLHTLTGDSYFKRCRFERNGRTGIQCVGRDTEAGYSQHKLGVTDCVFEDNGLQDGGSQLTAGGVRGVVVQSTRLYFGRDKEYVARYKASHPEKSVFGQGHIVNWDDKGRQQPTQLFAMYDVLAWSLNEPGYMPTGSGTAVSIRNSEIVNLSGELHVSSGWSSTALQIVGAQVDISDLSMLNVEGDVVLA